MSKLDTIIANLTKDPQITRRERLEQARKDFSGFTPAEYDLLLWCVRTRLMSYRAKLEQLLRGGGDLSLIGTVRGKKRDLESVMAKLKVLREQCPTKD